LKNINRVKSEINSETDLQKSRITKAITEFKSTFMVQISSLESTMLQKKQELSKSQLNQVEMIELATSENKTLSLLVLLYTKQTAQFRRMYKPNQQICCPKSKHLLSCAPVKNNKLKKIGEVLNQKAQRTRKETENIKNSNGELSTQNAQVLHEIFVVNSRTTHVQDSIRRHDLELLSRLTQTETYTQEIAVGVNNNFDTYTENVSNTQDSRIEQVSGAPNQQILMQVQSLFYRTLIVV